MAQSSTLTCWQITERVGQSSPYATQPPPLRLALTEKSLLKHSSDWKKHLHFNSLNLIVVWQRNAVLFWFFSKKKRKWWLWPAQHVGLVYPTVKRRGSMTLDLILNVESKYCMAVFCTISATGKMNYLKNDHHASSVKACDKERSNEWVDTVNILVTLALRLASRLLFALSLCLGAVL